MGVLGSSWEGLEWIPSGPSLFTLEQGFLGFCSARTPLNYWKSISIEEMKRLRL